MTNWESLPLPTVVGPAASNPSTAAAAAIGSMKAEATAARLAASAVDNRWGLKQQQQPNAWQTQTGAPLCHCNPVILLLLVPSHTYCQCWGAGVPALRAAEPETHHAETELVPRSTIRQRPLRCKALRRLGGLQSQVRFRLHLYKYH